MKTKSPYRFKLIKPTIHSTKKIFVLWVSLVVLAAVICWVFVATIRSLLLEDAVKNLSAISVQAAVSFDANFKSRLGSLEALALLNEVKDPSVPFPKKLELIDQEANRLRFYSIWIADLEGTAHSSASPPVFIGDRDYFIRALNGAANVSDPLVSRAAGASQVVVYAVPIIHQNKTIGVLFASDLIESIANFLDQRYYSGEATAFILDSRGNVLAHDSNFYADKLASFFDVISLETDKKSLISFKNDLDAGRRGVGTFTYLGSDEYVGYTPLKTAQGWYFLISAPSDAFLRPANRIISFTAALVSLLVLCIVCIFVYSSREKKRYTDRLKLSEERYQIISELTEDMIIDWNLITGEFYCSPNWEKRFGAFPLDGARGSLNPTSGIFHPEDFYLVYNMIKKLQRGEDTSQLDFRAKALNGNFVWLRAISTVVFDVDNRPLRAICVLLDVTDIKNKEQSLINEAKYDFLTKVYSRAAFEERATVEIDLARNRGAELAFMFVDIDDFKSFNDNFGHAFGDRVLSFVGERLRSNVDSIGFVGRNGGDEFIVCITDKQSIATVDVITQKLISELSGGLKTRASDKLVPVSCSIGVAFFPHSGTSYQELVSKADLTMYQAKNSGKGTFRLFGKSK